MAAKDSGKEGLKPCYQDLGGAKGGHNNEVRQYKSKRGRPSKATVWTRDRSNSEPVITDYLIQKRKRSQHSTSFSDPEDPSDPSDNTNTETPINTREKRSKKSRIFTSSPTPPETGNMEQKLDMILNRLNGVEASLHSEITNLRKDINERIRKLEEENDQLKKMNKELMAREKKTENILEKHDKALKKLNVWIEGLPVDPSSCLDEVNEFLKTTFQIPNAAVEANVVGNRHNKKILAKFSSWTNKIKVMRQKKEKLRDGNIYIKNDMTEKEQTIAYQGRSLARDIIAKGGTAKAFNNKVIVNGQTMVWSEEQEKFVPMREPKRNSHNNYNRERTDVTTPNHSDMKDSSKNNSKHGEGVQTQQHSIQRQMTGSPAHSKN